MLNNVHKKCLESSNRMLEDKTVCKSLDGWSNVHNEPVICATVISESEIYFVDIVDTSSNAHTAIKVTVNPLKNVRISLLALCTVM